MKKKIISIGIAALVATGLVACSNSGHGQEMNKENVVNQKQDEVKGEVSRSEKAIAVLESLATGNPQPITDYVNRDKYIQHNLTFSDGRQTILDALAPLKEAGSTAEVIRVLEDGEYVAVQMKYNLFGQGENAAFDIFRFEEGLIVEHWDNLQAVAEPNPSGHTQFDGPTKVIDLEKTEENKKIVVNFVKDVLVGENPANITSYIQGDHYIQHNIHIADGLTGLNAALEEFAKQGLDMVYNKIHLTVGEGNFVLVASEGTLGDIPTAFYDLFRVEDGKIVEHWDVVESILDKELHANENGKF